MTNRITIILEVIVDVGGFEAEEDVIVDTLNNIRESTNAAVSLKSCTVEPIE